MENKLSWNKELNSYNGIIPKDITLDGELGLEGIDEPVIEEEYNSEWFDDNG